MSAAAPRVRKHPLSRARVLAQAVQLADERGVAALSMRGLAHSLGNEVMALYNHVANKDELLALMVDAVAAEVPAPACDLSPLSAIRAVAVETRSALARHPWAAELWQQYLPGPARTGLMETLLRLFDETGLDPELAHHGFHAVVNHVIGYALQDVATKVPSKHTNNSAEDYLAGVSVEDHPRTIAHVRRHMDSPQTSSFDLVLDLVLDGFVRLDRAST